jgi:hypothetical protein
MAMPRLTKQEREDRLASWLHYSLIRKAQEAAERK